MRRLLPVPLAAGLLLLAGCATAAAPTAASRPDQVRTAATPAPAPAAAAAAAAADAVRAPAFVPQRGPFRATGRGTFSWRTAAVTAARLGSSHRAGCPVSVADLRLLTVTHWDLAGDVRRGQLVVHRDVAPAVVGVFRALHTARFPLARMETVDRFGGDDARSMAANNTSAYNCRATTGGSTWSEHAYGRALDVNPVQNPYVRGTTVEPAAGRDFLDRTRRRPGMVVAGDAVVRAFAAAGWEWGGDYRTLKDYQHFSQSGR